MNLGILYFHSSGASQGTKRAHGRSPELAVSRQEGKLFPASVLRYFIPKTKKNGFGLFEDGLNVPRDGVDPVTGGQRWTFTEHQCTGQWGEAAAWASSHILRGFWRDLVRSVPSFACVQSRSRIPGAVVYNSNSILLLFPCYCPNLLSHITAQTPSPEEP